MGNEKVSFLDLVTVHNGIQEELVGVLRTAPSP